MIGPPPNAGVKPARATGLPPLAQGVAGIGGRGPVRREDASGSGVGGGGEAAAWGETNPATP